MKTFIPLVAGALLIPVFLICWNIAGVIATSLYRASRDAKKWIPLPLTDGSPGWKKTYLIPKLWFYFFWQNLWSSSEITFFPTE